jgi:sugar phosphate isomerase/epimerase
MKLGVMGALFNGMKIDEALKYCQKVGLDAIELPAGAYPSDPWGLGGIAKDKKALVKLKSKIADYGLTVQGIAVHGNPVHPDPKIAKAHQAAHRNGVLLAEAFETVVVNFSGCPGGAKGDKTPNFVTCPWPDDFSKAADYQWNQVLIPFWSKENKFAAAHGVKIAFEAHPGMTVHNPTDIVRLREAAGANLGENKCIFHVHAKDCAIDPKNSRLTGNLDIRSYGDVKNRSWVFRTCGYGHGDEFWKPFISMLRLYEYDGVISIEHEDGLMSMAEGFEKAIAYLKGVILTQKTGQAWWF